MTPELQDRAAPEVSRKIRGLILMYHNVTAHPANIWDVTPADLRTMVSEIRAQGLRIASPGEIQHGTDPMVAFTFDDAYTGVYTEAFPVLSSVGLTATVFVPLNFVGGMNTFDYMFDFGPRRPARIMDWPQLRELADAGWSIQSHTCSHVPLSCMETAHLEDELQRSKGTLEDRLGSAVRFLAYPFGMGLEASQHDLLVRSGYELAFLADGGWSECPPLQPFAIPRSIATSGDFSLPSALD